MKDDGSPIVLKKFKHGQSNPTYYVKFAGKEMVLRKKPVRYTEEYSIILLNICHRNVLKNGKAIFSTSFLEILQRLSPNFTSDIKRV